MKSGLIPFLLCFGAIFLPCIAGCQKSGPTTLTSKDGMFEITVFEGMAPNSQLNLEATIQAANLFKELYVVVISEPKTDFESDTDLSDYASLSRMLISQSVGGNPSELVETKTEHGFSAQRLNCHAKVDGVDVGYVVTFVDTGEHFHQLMTWTLEGRFAKYQSLLERIGGTIRPTQPPLAE